MESALASAGNFDTKGCKLPKPLVEKRRRARFNKSLEELKHLVPEMAHGAIRMDKADILELTVSHLKALQEDCSSDMDANTDPSYKDGFKRCIDEIAQVIVSTPVTEDVKGHLLAQLQILSRGHQPGYSPLTPEYEQQSELNSGSIHLQAHLAPTRYLLTSSSSRFTGPTPGVVPPPGGGPVGPGGPLFATSTLSPLSTNTSPNAINLSSSSPFERASAFTAPDHHHHTSNTPTHKLIKEEVRSPGGNSGQGQAPSGKIWRPW